MPRHGVIPKSQDYRWFAFYEDGWLYLHRSWTGFCNWQIKLERNGDDYVATEIWVNRHPEQQYRQLEKSEDEQHLQRVLSIVFGLRDHSISSNEFSTRE